jgi:hypothetical protein
MDETMCLDELFTKDPQLPFHYNIQFKELNHTSSTSEIFKHLTDLFSRGLLLISNGNLKFTNQNGEFVDHSSIDIGKMSDDDFNKIKKRFLSIGIDVKHKIYDESDKDYYLRSVCYSAAKIKGLTLEVSMDWSTQFINKINFKATSKDIFPDIMNAIEKTPEANYFLQLATPKYLKDYVIKYSLKTDPSKLHIINFDVAKLTDHHYNHAMCTYDTRHIR